MDDNVIHDWSDGKRCIGLSDQEIIQRYKEIAHKYAKDERLDKIYIQILLTVISALRSISVRRSPSQINGE